MKPTEEKTPQQSIGPSVYLFKQGNKLLKRTAIWRTHRAAGRGDRRGVFRVWAPHATAISVVGDFNSWKPGSHPMRKVDNDSVWELFIRA